MWSPSKIASCSSTKILVCATSRAHRFRSFARSGVPRGPFRACLLPASFGGARPVVLLFHTANAAKIRSVCIALLLLIRDLSIKLGVVTLTSDFNKGVEREAAANGSMDHRRMSPLEAAFSHANIPWPTSGIRPLWGPIGEPHGGTWPECCGFVVLPVSQSQWRLMRHGSVNVVSEATGLKTTDHTWHYEQWLHLKVAGRKRRRDVSPADSKSRQKIVLHTNK